MVFMSVSCICDFEGIKMNNSIHRFHNSMSETKTRDYWNFSCLFT